MECILLNPYLAFSQAYPGFLHVLFEVVFQVKQYPVDINVEFRLAEQGCLGSKNSTVEQSSSATQERNLRQILVTVKQHVLHLKSFACGGSDSTEKSLIDMADFDEEESQFKDIKDSFQDISPKSYPLVITFHKFLMMLDGTLSNSCLEA